MNINNVPTHFLSVLTMYMYMHVHVHAHYTTLYHVNTCIVSEKWPLLESFLLLIEYSIYIVMVPRLILRVEFTPHRSRVAFHIARQE